MKKKKQKQKQKWIRACDPIEDMKSLFRHERSMRNKMKCFKVNSCKYKEHDFECDDCVFYRRK